MVFAAHLTTAGSPPAAAAIEVTGDLPACALVAFTQTGGAGASDQVIFVAGTHQGDQAPRAPCGLTALVTSQRV
jgi:hypothetical protein